MYNLNGKKKRRVSNFMDTQITTRFPIYQKETPQEQCPEGFHAVNHSNNQCIGFSAVCSLWRKIDWSVIGFGLNLALGKCW